MSSRKLSAIVLAAGEGTRMRSSRPKPIHLLCGRPMVLHVLDALAELQVSQVVVVVGHGADRVTKTLNQGAPEGLEIHFVEQEVQRGTGDAVGVGLTGFPDGYIEDLDDDDDVVVLPGDAPLLRPATLAQLVRNHRASEAAATLLTAELDDPWGYGRVIRAKDGRVAKVVEEPEASPDEQLIREVNTSIYCFRRSVLAPALRRISPENSKGEYYLTDVVSVLHDAGYLVVTMIAADPTEAVGVNDRAQLAGVEAELRARTNEKWMRKGVTMVDPEQTYLDATVRLGQDVTLFPGTFLQGVCVIEDGAQIGPNTQLIDCTVGQGTKVTFSQAERAQIGANCDIGPFAYLEPGAVIEPGTQSGPYFRG